VSTNGPTDRSRSTSDFPLPDGWSIIELRNRDMKKIPGGHNRHGRSPVPREYFTGEKTDATDAQLHNAWKVLLRYDPPGGGDRKIRTLIRANSRRKVARGIETIIAETSPV
jgi:hypothetical protein